MEKVGKKIGFLLVAIMLLFAISMPTYAAVKINKTTHTVCTGQTFQLKISGNKKTATWSSNKKSVATVAANGKVTARKKGTAIIRAKVGTKQYTCKVTVESPNLSKTKVTLYKGKAATLKMENTSQTYTWSSSDKTIATVTSKGKVTAKKAGSVKIYAKSASGKKFSCTVTVKNATSSGDSDYAKLSKYKVVVRTGYYETLYFNGSSDVTYESTNKNVFKIASSGNGTIKIKGVSKGTAYLLAKQGSTVNVCTVVVDSGQSFVSRWVKVTANQIKSQYPSTEDRLVQASMLIIGQFDYGTVSYRNGLQDVIAQKKGTCHSAGLVLAEIYKALGYEATVRSAIQDDMSRYPSGISFGSDHYNVRVVANKKTYYVDATPACGFAYLSSSSEPLRYYFNFGSGWYRLQ